jgi:glutathione synthase/RimK-type ligase-like ATP-grasp enzyme
MAASKPILLVMHGRGRGRGRTFLPWLFEEITKRPRLHKLIQVHSTGDAPPALDGFGALVFMLSDPLYHYPECEAEALSLSAAARALGIRTVNPPEALNNTVKSTQSELWRAAGIPSAQGAPAADEAALREVLERVRYPVIVRFDAGHRQDGIFVCLTKEAALRHVSDVRYPAVALPFVDTRASWQQHRPDSVMARHFHKKRIMVFPNAVINNHVFFSALPVVGNRTSAFTAASKGESVPDLADMIAADIVYSLAPPERPKLMQAAVRALGLDFAAIDYACFADGKVVLWEANPSFALPHWSQAVLPEPRRLEARNPRYMAALLDFFAQLAGIEARTA